MENIAIQVNKVSKIFKLDKPLGISKIVNPLNYAKKKTLKALDEISFTVNKGEILGIIGLNGSGKTTLLRIIAGVYKPNFGTVEVNGRISALMQLGTGFQGDLDALENIIMNGMLLGISKPDILKKVDAIIEYAELEKFVNMKLKYFSTGMRARLAYGIAMQVDPDVLLIDEVLSVGDIGFQKKSYETFLSLTKSKKTILHSTHNLNKLAEFSDRVLLLHKGKLVQFGPPDEVIKKYKSLSMGNAN